jgi:hypothetical protein
MLKSLFKRVIKAPNYDSDILIYIKEIFVADLLIWDIKLLQSLIQQDERHVYGFRYLTEIADYPELRKKYNDINFNVALDLKMNFINMEVEMIKNKWDLEVFSIE